MIQVRQFDTKYKPEFIIKDRNKNVVDLTGCSVQFVAGNRFGVLVDRAANIVDAAAGKVNFTFQSIDFASYTGKIKVELIVDFPDGTRESFPNGENYLINVLPTMKQGETVIDGGSFNDTDFSDILDGGSF